MDEQTRFLSELQEVVRATDDFRRAEAKGELISLPTGDGMALVFFHNPVAPIRCAVDISRALRERPHLKLRMGIHSGAVYRVQDINANSNVAGSGINIAQRVMDSGDAGHILLSSTMAELLREIRQWSAAIHDLGPCEVKHGVRIHLYNFFTGTVGNPELPEKLRERPATASLLYSFRPNPMKYAREIELHYQLIASDKRSPDRSAWRQPSTSGSYRHPPARRRGYIGVRLRHPERSAHDDCRGAQLLTRRPRGRGARAA